ncbi:FAD-linked oxidoreductase [Haloactinopolyspora alba]|uniref:FAD-linked oxidoreductase n=1 Tax=Haloactinopolyspora alba TaxID=648780 RepID=A0A2P8E2L7_9ACTN|nr:D-arabinono-1,4-lactone oxidase [Haloactinopolyspora alba]PSL03715.1 FAD-linked oxidoreductase [Haloactinopolyspora alba]
MTWRNWARTVHCDPRRVVRPADADEVAAVVADAARRNLRVKAAGAGHSFTPVAATDGVLVLLDRLRGLLALEPAADGGAEATVAAGTTIRELNDALAVRGYGLRNMGDVAVQTVAGAVSTGTHGTGRASAALAAAVRRVRMVLPDGSLADVAADDHGDGADLFHAARLGLGALGVITAVTFHVEPAFRLRAVQERAGLDDVLDAFHDLAADEEHVEFYWLPFTDAVQLKRNRRTDERPTRTGRLSARLSNEVVENAGVALTQRLSRAVPRVTPAVNRAAARLIGRRSSVDDAPAVFTSTRRVRFHEMEYALPRAAAVPALRELRELTAGGPWRIAFPVEVRTAPADDVWLSPAHARDTVYVATHAYPGTDYRGWFDAAERLWTSYAGRPHWGKLHTRDITYLSDHYDRLHDFRAVRDRVDPERIMTNQYLDRVLGP